MKKTAAFHTLGCKVNAYETEAMKQSLLRAGYEILPFTEKADVYVINTCSVTNIADRKSRQMLHRARALNPDAVVVAAGCYAQGAAELLRSDETVDLILGNEEKNDLAGALERWFRNTGDAGPAGPDDGAAASGGAAVFGGTADGRGTGRHLARVEAGDIASVRRYDTAGADTMPDYTRAFLKIQDGCNQFCSYCVIPFVRGRCRSRLPEDIRREAAAFAEKGYRELVLTGIHLSSYGRDLAETQDLLSVVQLLDKVPGVERIRIGSLEPEIITEEFVRGLSACSHFCPHFHLSLQSGSDTVLGRMNRRYTAEQFLAGTELIRRVFPDAALTTDIIAGFPGETEEEFRETLKFAERVEFYEIHAFPYSRRAGTRAAAMKGQLTRAEKAERTAALTALSHRQARAFREKRIGRTEEILTEDAVSIGGTSWLTGFTREYVRIALPEETCRKRGIGKNALVRGTVTGFLGEDLLRMELREGG